MGSYGFKVSKAGYDVSTATNDQLSATSALLSETVAIEGTMTLNHSGTSGSVTLTHNLGSARQFVVGYNGAVILPKLFGDTSSGTAIAVDVISSANTLKIQSSSQSSQTISASVYYKILNNTI